MRRITKSNHSGMKLVASFYLVLILFALITVASYTWFTISRIPKVNDMNLYIHSAPRMELSTDPTAEKWTLQLDMEELMPDTAPLLPVTWVDEEQCFYAAQYGANGRQTGWKKLSDETNANKNDTNGYYIKLTFYARTDLPVTVSLSPAVEVDQGIHGSGTYLIGTPVWNDETISHDNAGLGAEMAMRMGIRITPVDGNGEPTGEKSEFFIYEPNCDRHIDGSVGYRTTPGINGSESLIDAAHLIRQSNSQWTDTDPVEQGVVVKELGDFLDKPILCTLERNQMVRMDIYIWLEGQDVDCTATIDNAQIMACLQFDSDPQGGSGLKPLE